MAGRACGASLRNPFAEAIVTGRARYTMDVAIEGLLHLKVLRSPACPCADHAHRARAGVARAGRRRDLHLGRRAAPPLQHRDARGSPRRSRRHLRARQRRPLRRPAGRGGGRRDRGASGGGLPADRGRVRILPAVFDPEAAMQPDAPVLHEKGTAAAAATSMSISTARSAAPRTGSPRPRWSMSGTYSTSRVQHVHLETHGSIAWQRRGGPRPRAHQLAGAVHRAAEALPHLRLARGRRSRVHRARRRRLRRQAGDGVRGSLRPRHAEDRPAGELGVDARGSSSSAPPPATR